MISQHLVAADFDGTLSETFKNSPHGMNVQIACENAVRDIFGNPGVNYYHNSLGGLGDREPDELVTLLNNGIGGSRKDNKHITHIFNDRKLSYLLPEISPQWPHLYPGVAEFYRSTASGDIHVTTAIVSSGHDEFIKKVFKVNNITLPDIIVTSDFLLTKPELDRPRHKPYTYQLAEAHRQWRNGFRDNGGLTAESIGRKFEKPNILYIGDDPNKDGGLAVRARVPYLYVPFTRPGFQPDQDKGQAMIPDFHALSKILKDRSEQLRRGESFASILFGRQDAEIFPPLTENARMHSLRENGFFKKKE